LITEIPPHTHILTTFFLSLFSSLFETLALCGCGFFSEGDGVAAAAEGVGRVRGAEQRLAEARRDPTGRREPTGSRDGAATTAFGRPSAPPRQPARRAGQQFCPFAPAR